MTPERLAQLRAIAEHATPGPWETRDRNDGYLFVASDSMAIVSADRPWDLAFIATFDPPTVLALLSALEEAA